MKDRRPQLQLRLRVAEALVRRGGPNALYWRSRVVEIKARLAGKEPAKAPARKKLPRRQRLAA